jgi:Tfp pilus assembly protein PilO
MDKMKQWSMLTALGVVGVLAAGWFLLVSPQHAHAKDLRTQAQGVQATTAQLQSQVQQLKAQNKGVAAQQAKLAKIAKQIPDNPALPTLIRQLSAAAHDSGVTLVSRAPTAPTAVTAAPTAVSPTAAGAASPLTQIPIGVTVTGSYFNIESFFRSVEHLDRAIMATGFTLAPNGSSGTSTDTSGGGDAANAAPGALSAQIQAVIFMSPAAIAATAPAPLTPTVPATTGTAGSTAQTPSTASTAPAANPAQ